MYTETIIETKVQYDNMACSQENFAHILATEELYKDLDLHGLTVLVGTSLLDDITHNIKLDILSCRSIAHAIIYNPVDKTLYMNLVQMTHFVSDNTFQPFDTLQPILSYFNNCTTSMTFELYQVIDLCQAINLSICSLLENAKSRRL